MNRRSSSPNSSSRHLLPTRDPLRAVCNSDLEISKLSPRESSRPFLSVSPLVFYESRFGRLRRRLEEIVILRAGNKIRIVDGQSEGFPLDKFPPASSSSSSFFLPPSGRGPFPCLYSWKLFAKAPPQPPSFFPSSSPIDWIHRSLLLFAVLEL